MHLYRIRNKTLSVTNETTFYVGCVYYCLLQYKQPVEIGAKILTLNQLIRMIQNKKKNTYVKNRFICN